MKDFGYEEYNASPLEYTEIYKAKSGEEIAKEQTYTFKDKGDRTISLRPEMTPTAARMIAKRNRELIFPVRWYSISNIFRYESPQKGRLREHYQLNADIFGGVPEKADLEMIDLTHRLMRNFGAKTTDFTIRMNDRRILGSLYDIHQIDEDDRPSVSKLLDKKNKISEKELIKEMTRYLDKERVKLFLETISTPTKTLEDVGQEHPAVKHIVSIIEELSVVGITNIIFDPTLVRGFDYYTGFVFEVFDTDPDNSRSIFGGGRYDTLISLFCDREIPAVGFGLGDVRLLEFLKSHSLLPLNETEVKVMICHMNEHPYARSSSVANVFRDNNIPTEVDISGKKIKDQISKASKKNIPFIVVIGEDEKMKVKHLDSKEEREMTIEDAIEWITETLITEGSWQEK